MSPSNGDYIHGTDPEEQRRLSLLNDLMNETSLRAMGLQGGERILDVGCGLGQLARAMARAAAPRGHVVAVERDTGQLEEAKRKAHAAGDESLIDFRHGDALALPLAADEWGTFDVAHTRFLLEHVPEPRIVVDAMVQAVRPGGRIVLEDDDHDLLRLWPEPEGVRELWHAYIETYRELGNDPYVGRRLVSLLHEAGAKPDQNTWHFFGSCAGNSTFRGYVDNFVGVVESARAIILSSTDLRPADFDAAVAAFREWSLRPDAAFWYCTFWAQGYRPL